MERAVFQINDESSTVSLAGCLARSLEAGDVVGLCGDLGAGKTFFSSAVCRALSVPGDANVSSPTFTLINEYSGGRLPVYHMDLYRLGDPGELYELGLWEYYDGDGVCLVEWCDRFDDLWPPDSLVMTIQLGVDEQRRIEVRGTGRGAQLVRSLVAAFGASG